MWLSWLPAARNSPVGENLTQSTSSSSVLCSLRNVGVVTPSAWDEVVLIALGLCSPPGLPDPGDESATGETLPATVPGDTLPTATGDTLPAGDTLPTGDTLLAGDAAPRDAGRLPARLGLRLSAPALPLSRLALRLGPVGFCGLMPKILT